MSDSRSKSLFTIAKKEFMDNVRNRWIMALTALFVIFIVMISTYQGHIRDDAGFEDIITFSRELNFYLIAIVAIMLGYKTLAKEVESKSIGLLLTSELDRKEIVLGKFVGLGSVLAFIVIVGFGIGGVISGFTIGFGDSFMYFEFMIASFLFSLSFLSVSILISSMVNRRSRALAGGVFIWIFFMIIWDILLLVGAIATGWEFEMEGAAVAEFPEWFYQLALANPADIFYYITPRITGSEAMAIPDFLSIEVLWIGFLIWIILPLVGAALIFDKKDL